MSKLDDRLNQIEEQGGLQGQAGYDETIDWLVSELRLARGALQKIKRLAGQTGAQAAPGSGSDGTRNQIAGGNFAMTVSGGIPFTQFMRPDGRPVPRWIDRPAQIESVAKRLIEAGYKFEIECLMTGDISMEVVSVKLDEHGDPVSLAMEVVPNGPEVPPAVDRLVEKAAKAARIDSTT